MKVFTPEISWHQKEPIFSVDFCNSTWKLASAGADFTIKIWQLKEDSEGNIGLDFLANLDRHSKPVNCVRFSPDGKFLASAGDDCIIIIWKLSEDEDDHMIAEPSFGSDDIVNKEKWAVHKMLRRGHLEDIYDLDWSPDGNYLVSGSVDNSAIIWDVSKGHFTSIIKDHKHYVQGVCWDPRGQYVVTHSSDRTCKIYSLSKNRCVHTIHKSTFPILNPVEDGPKQKSTKLFMDETMQSFFRRCSFSPDGLLLALPGGIYDSGEKPVKATYIYARGGFSKPALCLPGSKKASVGVCFCPIIFENMANKGEKENQPPIEGLFKLPYRMCYAVATLNSIVFYDTQHSHPFGFVSNIHYASLTDMTWSSDGRIVVVSSLDGYCSIISFENGELGKPSSVDPVEYVSSKLKAKREAKKEANKVQVESKANGAMANEKEKEQIATARPSPARTTKDQPTLHQFVTPIRKRKRSIEKGESPQTPPSRTPSTSTPTQSTPSGGTPKMIPGKGTPKSPINLCEDGQSPVVESPVTTEHQTTNQASSVTKSTKAPKRANLISLGFKPIAKPSMNAAMTAEEGKSTKAIEMPEQRAAQNLQGKPRRITFTTNEHVLEKPRSTAEDDQYSDVMVQKQVSPSCNTNHQQVKEPRRISLVSLSAKRDHSGISKEASSINPVENESAIKQISEETKGSVKNFEKPIVDPKRQEVEGKSPVVPNQKPTRRVEVITLLDDSPEKIRPPKSCVSGQQFVTGSSTSFATVSSEVKSISSDGHKAPIINTNATASLELEGSSSAVGSHNSSKDTQLDASIKSPSAPIKDPTDQSEKTDIKSPDKEVRVDCQSKDGSSPLVKAPKRVGFVTLTSNNSKQNTP